MTQGLSSTDVGRLSGCLERLVPHLRPGSVAITGSVGMQLGMARLGRQGPRDELADLDMVAACIEAISPTVVEQFLVSHYHVARPGGPKFMVQLVDPLSRIRVDVFPDLVGALVDAGTIGIGEHLVQVLPLARIFDHKRLTVSRASRSSPIDPKHVQDAQVLGELLGKRVPTVAMDALVPDVYGIDADWHCERCDVSRHSSWPLAPRDRIFELLGWTQRTDTHAARANGARAHASAVSRRF